MKESEFYCTVKNCKNGKLIGEFIPAPNSQYFLGHFPDNPIVPGVLLLEISLRLLAKALNISRSKVVVKKLKKISFMKPVFPNSPVEIELDRKMNDTIIRGTNLGEAIFSFIFSYKVV